MGTGFVARQLPSYVTVPLLVAADVSRDFCSRLRFQEEPGVSAAFVLE